jgi:hypothetical protein
LSLLASIRFCDTGAVRVFSGDMGLIAFVFQDIFGPSRIQERGDRIEARLSNVGYEL